MAKQVELEAVRFLTIAYIANGHFAQAAIDSRYWLGVFKQHNVAVAIFFLLSGYLLARSSHHQTELSWWQYFRRRLNRLLPVYWAVMALFLPMYVTIDLHYGATIQEIGFRFLVTWGLIQSWSPDWALWWNSPTWFLSSLVFCYACFPVVHGFLHRMRPLSLCMLGIVLFVMLLAVRLWYSTHAGFWLQEGLAVPAKIPLFDWMRFFPLFNALEFFIGMAFGYLVHATRASDSRPSQLEGGLSGYTGLVLVAVSLLVALTRPLAPVNGMLTRTLVALPLFLAFLFAIETGRTTGLGWMRHVLFARLGAISYSLYVFHGALGHLFFKKAARQWTGLDASYSWYWLCLFLGAFALHRVVEQRLHAGRLSETSARE